MLKDKMRWIFFSDMLEDEYYQCLDEGRQVEMILPRIKETFAMRPGLPREEAAKKLLVEMEAAPIREDYPHQEPQDYEELLASLRPEAFQTWPVMGPCIEEKLAGALYGRVIGCVMGIPVEGWGRDKILSYLKATGQYPLKSYMFSTQDPVLRERFDIHEEDPTTPYDRQVVCWRNCLTAYPNDDDINYTLLALKVLERYGAEFSSEDMAETWLLGIPAFHACTAERAAIRNLMNGLLPPLSASYCNPYREWIGAQIRGDLFGYVRPGDPMAAAKLAYQDAAVSHKKNGIYGEMFIAAWLSLCYVDGLSMLERVKAALEQIPPHSRLKIAIEEVCAAYENGDQFQKLIDSIHARYDEKRQFDWCLAVPNAMIVTACTLWHDSFEEAVAAAICSGFDTDCNGATVGSLFGLSNSLERIPVQLRMEFPTKICSSVHGYHEMSFDDILERIQKQLRLPKNNINTQI